MLKEWQRFLEGHPPSPELSGVILESWQRCRSYSLDTARASLRRVPPPELQLRLERNARLLEAARGHLRWALATMAPLHPVVILLTDVEGIIIESVGNAPEVMTQFGLIPGYDWSERAMGTNGIGTALAFGAPVAVIGPEHYTQSWHNNTCVGAPIRSPEGTILGAVDISTTAADGDPARLVLVSFLAHLIARELGGTGQGVSAFAGPDVLSRATAPGASARASTLEQHARELDALTGRLAQTARTDLVRLAHAQTPVRLDELLRRRISARDDEKVTLLPTPPVLLRGAPERFELLIEHLLELAARRHDIVKARLELCADVVSLTLEGTGGAGSDLGTAWRVENTGTVLGLWIARELTESLQGQFTFHQDGNGVYVARFQGMLVG